jgi:cytochrome P450
LGLLLAAVDEETGRGMEDEALRDEVLSFLFAGHETTANSLAWCLHLLAAHPEEQERLHAEVAALGRAPTSADLPALPRCRRALDETLRLYPPAWWLERRAIADDTLGGFVVPAGTRVALSTWLTHRHPGFWEDPLRFDPDRFLPARAEGRHRYAYYPFAAGPRGCIGAASAMVILTLALTTILGAWRVHPVPARPVRLEPLIAVRSATGVHLRVERRT